jgi:DNA-binding NtrC family response regulator
MSRPRVLVVEDKENMLKLLVRVLGENFEVTTAPDGAQALALVGSTTFDVVLTDLRMPNVDGLQVLRTTKEVSPDTEVVLMTAFASIQDAVEAIRQGAYDYLQKPFDPDAASLVVSRAAERKLLRQQTNTLRREVQTAYGFANIIGRSPRMKEVFLQIQQAAALDITTLVLGETGTGKELVARAIHYASARKDGQFVPVNCGALPRDLIESELFGHARGAFTGAAGPKPGLFEEAQGGTIFLDEIGELPLPVQVKLNRVLQEREIRRVGNNASTKVDVRVIAATHRDLKAEVGAGRFREDLFYRLHVFPILLPALKHRQEDIPLLASHFLAKHCKAYGRQVETFSTEALDALLRHPWPGNVRELENVVERVVAVSSTKEVKFAELPPDLREPRQQSLLAPDMLARMTYRQAVDSARDSISKAYLDAVLRSTDGNVTRAAEQAGMERESVHRLMRKYGLHSEDYKASADRVRGPLDQAG